MYDPFETSRALAEAQGENRSLVQSVPRDAYMANLRHLIDEGLKAGAESVLLADQPPFEDDEEWRQTFQLD